MKKSTQKTAHIYIAQIENYASAALGEKADLQHRALMKLLSVAYQKQFGLDLASLNLRKLENGKWVCDKHFFSLSHSGGYVCVALSESPVGVDLQRQTDAPTDKLAKRIFVPQEYQAYQQCDDKTDGFFFTWCKKEALWKSLDEQTQTIYEIDTTQKQFSLFKLQKENGCYYLAATGNAVLETN